MKKAILFCLLMGVFILTGCGQKAPVNNQDVNAGVNTNTDINTDLEADQNINTGSQATDTSWQAIFPMDVFDIGKIKEYFVKKYNWGNVEISIWPERDENHVRGSVTFIGKYGSDPHPGFLMAKLDGKWQLAHEGVDVKTCQSMEKYNFPREMIADCVDEDNPDIPAIKEELKKIVSRSPYSLDMRSIGRFWLEKDGDYVRGEFRYPVNFNYDIFGVKRDDRWRVVLLSLKNVGYYCHEFDNYNFPSEMISDCKSVVLGNGLTLENFGEVNKYTSSDLGVTFTVKTREGGINQGLIEVKKQENKIFVGGEAGQSVEIFIKDPNLTLKQAIEKQFLNDYDHDKCFVEEVTGTLGDGYPDTYLLAEISYPINNSGDDPWFENIKNCPQNYSKTNGIRYFLYDPSHPDRYAFFSIGQYGISGDISNMLLWQETFRFMDI